MNKSAFDHEYQEFLEEKKSDEIEKEYKRKDESIQDETGEHRKEAPKIIIVRAPEQNTTEDSNVLPTQLQPPKRERGRPALLRSGSVGRSRKLYHPMSNNDKENGSESNEISDNEGLPGETISDDDTFMECNLTLTYNPVTWREVKQNDDAWRVTMENEYLAQIRNNTWEIVPRPQERKVIGSRFVFCTKDNGSVAKKKVRLVAKGCSQRPGEDFHETYSPVARTTSIRLLAALAAEMGLQIHQMVVITAYLNGKLEEDVHGDTRAITRSANQNRCWKAH